MSNPLKILLVAAEISPFAKVGGLADVAGSLPKALEKLGHDIRVAMPKYKGIEAEFTLREIIHQLDIPMGNKVQPASILSSTLGRSIPVYFVRSDQYYDSAQVYGYANVTEVEKFIFFCKSILEMIKTINWIPDIIHCNDWHTALIPVLLRTTYQDNLSLSKVKTVFTIHNLAYQGTSGKEVLPLMNMNGAFNLASILHYNQINTMKAGILYADVVTTVSRTYAQEIQTKEYGEGLEEVIRQKSKVLFGILNGIDYEIWNPATDPDIAVNYDTNNLPKKMANKSALQKECALPISPDIPLIGMVTRLTKQKGLDLLIPIFDQISNLGVQSVILGTGDEYYHKTITTLASNHPQSVSVSLTFDNNLAKRIYAGSDMFLMPSRYEPCGLGQMISLRYGSIPIVRATGGLADTVQEFDPQIETGCGFLFRAYSSLDLFVAIQKAIDIFKNNKIGWNTLVTNAMQTDFSWEKSAQQYIDLYLKCVSGEIPSYPIEETKMPELRKNIITREWVVIATDRSKRPDDFRHKEEAAIVRAQDHSTCPFCPGNEYLTPPEITSYRGDSSSININVPGWGVRVFPNKFPALRVEGQLFRENVGLYDKMDGLGAHEVIVETPEHGKSLWQLDPPQIEKVIYIARERYLDLKRDVRLKYILIFKNYGRVAGASIEHSHCQLIATPVIPQQAWSELRGAEQYYEYRENCVYCDILKQESNSSNRTVVESNSFITIEPFASKYPFETWIIPKQHNCCFTYMTKEEVTDFAKILKETLSRLALCLNDPPYNFTFVNAPVEEENILHFHWHLEIIPRLTIAGGFELGTGIYINVTAPEEAARFLRAVEI